METIIVSKEIEERIDKENILGTSDSKMLPSSLSLGSDSFSVLLNSMEKVSEYFLFSLLVNSSCLLRLLTVLKKPQDSVGVLSISDKLMFYIKDMSSAKYSQDDDMYLCKIIASLKNN